MFLHVQIILNSKLDLKLTSSRFVHPCRKATIDIKFSVMVKTDNIKKICRILAIRCLKVKGYFNIPTIAHILIL